MTDIARNHEGAPSLDSSKDWRIYSGVAVDTDLRTAYPAYVTGGREMLPRLVWYSGGVLVVEDDYGNQTAWPGAAANVAWAIAPRWLIAAGSTATTIIVQW